MKATLVGIVLIVLGLAYQGFAYTSQMRILDGRRLETIPQTPTTAPVPPFVGALAVLGGAVVLVATSRGREAGL